MEPEAAGAPSSPGSGSAAEYLTARLQQLQRGIVNGKMSSSGTVDASIWISRSTVCDVVSVVTTIVPVKNGDMKDIRQHNKEMRRIRAPVARPPGKMLPGNPLEDGQVVDLERAHARNCSLLRKERKAFMEKLRTSRYIRTVVENGAAAAIQKTFRRFSVRINFERIRQDCLVHKRLRALVLDHVRQLPPQQQPQLKAIVSSLLFTPSMHRQSYAETRFKSARRIQCVFRKFLSRRVLRERRFEAILLKRRRAAVKIQCMSRKVASVALVKMLRTRRKISRFTRCALLIQNRVRIMFARRLVRKLKFKFRHIAARMIQCWYRAKHSKWKTSKVKELILRQKVFIGALGLQGLVRRRVARQRVYRLRLRRLFLYVFMSVLRIQCMVRRRLGLLRVRRVRAERLKASKELKAKQAEAAAKTKAQADALAAAAAAKQAEFNDIYHQLREGNAARVDDIFNGAGGACAARDPSHVNADGDTLLTLAAALGHTEIVNKCVVWQLDVNHRNRAGLSALMLAVKHGRLEAAQYLLSAPVKLKLNPTALIQDDAPYLILASLDALGQAALRGDAKKDHIDHIKALLQTHGLGSSVNSKDARFQNMTPLHMAAQSGVREAFSLIVKLHPATDAVDDLGHTALHKACLSPLAQVDTVKALLGLDSSATGILVPETKRTAALLRPDAQGRDCLVLAALAGQTTVLNFCVDFIQTDTHSGGGGGSAQKGAVSWTDADVQAALRLAQGGNDVCLSYLLSRGFDPESAAAAQSGMTLGMAACQYGHLVFVNVLLDRGVQIMAARDSRGRCAMHYAACCPTAGALVAHLLVHEKAKQCGIDEMTLAVQDKDGLTALHLAAMTGVEISVDLLARRGLAAALATRDKSPDGLTPLLTAAKFQTKNVVALYLRMSEDAKAVVDLKGRNAVWWFFHPAPAPSDPLGGGGGGVGGVGAAPGSAPGSAASGRRPPSSEFLARRGLQSKAPSKREREDAAQALESDIQTIKAMLAAGCSLFLAPQKPITPAELSALPSYDPKAADAAAAAAASVAEDRSQVEAGDLLVQELSFTALKALPEMLSPDDAWRLALACIRFDDGSSKALATFIEGGGAEALLTKLAGSQQAAAARKKNASEKALAQLAGKSFYGGLGLSGWCISLGNSSALQMLLRRGYDALAPVSSDKSGDTSLHLAAAAGTGAMIEAILEDPKVRIEAENARGFTPLMEAARTGNQKTAKRLVVHKASARRGMDGKYWGWMLAFARKQEETEKSLQTGRIGDDDVRYFPVRVPGWMLFAMKGATR